jgi:uncharacterized protein DUF3455
MAGLSRLFPSRSNGFEQRCQSRREVTALPVTAHLILLPTGDYNFEKTRSDYMNKKVKIKRLVALAIMIGVAGLTPASILTARVVDNDQTLVLPSPLCDMVRVPAGNKLAFHAYARGVQIYRWDGTAWVFVAPVATLFADANYSGQVGIHYAGPTWESNSGSMVRATRVAGCTPDPTAIPWLRLQSVTTSGPGVFRSITYVLRVNTQGGMAPATPGDNVGASVEVPYTAEYYFYREE